MSTKVFFLNSEEANYGEVELNYLQKFLMAEGILNTLGSDWEDWFDNGDLKVTERGAGANMSVDVSPGVAIISTERSSVAFKVFAEAIGTTNLPVAANSSGSNRVDAVIMRVSRSINPNALMNNVVTLQVVTGIDTSPMSDGEIATELGSSDDFIRLADIVVPNATADIEDGDITDTRVRAKTEKTFGLAPDVLELQILAGDPATPNLEEGYCWFNSVNHTLNYFNGTDVISLTGGGGIEENDVSNGAYIVGTTISFDATSKEIRDSGSGFVTAGFRAGQTITITGTVSNNADKTIVSVAAGVIVVEETLVNESAGSSFKVYCKIDSRVLRADSNGFVGAFPPYATDAEANDTYKIAVKGVYTYRTGQMFQFKANTLNTGVCTLNVNGLGAKTIKKSVTLDLETGDILAGQMVSVIYDGTNFQLLSRVSYNLDNLYQKFIKTESGAVIQAVISSGDVDAGDWAYLIYTTSNQINALPFKVRSDGEIQTGTKTSFSTSGGTFYQGLAIIGSTLFVSYGNFNSSATYYYATWNGSSWSTGNPSFSGGSRATNDFQFIFSDGTYLYICHSNSTYNSFGQYSWSPNTLTFVQNVTTTPTFNQTTVTNTPWLYVCCGGGLNQICVGQALKVTLPAWSSSGYTSGLVDSINAMFQQDTGQYAALPCTSTNKIYIFRGYPFRYDSSTGLCTTVGIRKILNNW